MNTTSEVKSSPTTRGASRTRASWLMVPLLVPSIVLAVFIAAVLLGLADLQGSEPLPEQGFVGWVVALLNLVLAPLPAYFGVWFGLTAHRLGEGAAALAATVVNGLAIVGLWVATIYPILSEW